MWLYPLKARLRRPCLLGLCTLISGRSCPERTLPTLTASSLQRGSHSTLCWTEAHQTCTWGNPEAQHWSGKRETGNKKRHQATETKVPQVPEAPLLYLLCPLGPCTWACAGSGGFSDNHLWSYPSIVLEISSWLLLRWLIYTNLLIKWSPGHTFSFLIFYNIDRLKIFQIF